MTREEALAAVLTDRGLAARLNLLAADYKGGATKTARLACRGRPPRPGYSLD